MRTTILALLACLLSITSLAQINFEQGYFLDNNDQKTECLIKNIDWKNNPTTFDYRSSEAGEVITTDISSIKEFGIDNFVKYVRHKVNIDLSSDQLDDLSKDKEPVFTEIELFLKVLVEGEASLYLYENGNLNKYFFNNSDTEIEQLVYRRYLVKGSKIAINNRYKQQLFNSLKCSSIAQRGVDNLKYRIKNLVTFFEKYNTCVNSAYINYQAKPTRDAINLTLRPSIRSSSLSIENSVSPSLNAAFESKLSFGLGLELEYVLPINKNKWSIILEPTYQYYKSRSSRDFGTPLNVDYQSLEVPLGLRHYFFLNDDSKLFLNVALIYDFDFNSKIEFSPSSPSNLDIDGQYNYAVGAGYKLKNKYSIELRYQTNRDILTDYRFWFSDYKSISLILGYSFF